MPTRSSATSTSGATGRRPAAQRHLRGAIDRPAAGDRHQDQGRGTFTVPAHESPAQIRAFAVGVANQDYADYHCYFLSPPVSLMVDVGLWIALEATIGFIVGLGLSSLMGQRTVAVILLIVLELILTPIFSRHVITHLSTSSGGSSGWPWPILSRVGCRRRSTVAVAAVAVAVARSPC